MTADTGSLKWTAQFTVTPPTRTQKLPGDKILLPPSALEQLLAAAPVVSSTSQTSHSLTPQFDPFNPHTFAAERRARELTVDRQQQLPHPLTFRVVNSANNRVVYAGIREFSAQDNEVVLSSFLRQSLGFENSDFGEHDTTPGASVPEKEQNSHESKQSDSPSLLPTVTVHAKQLPKGSHVRLRPLEAGYDPEDWKALLERYLRENFTTLTIGEILTVPGGRSETFRFLVDKVLPQGDDGICIVDTDLEVDIEALNEEQARETLRRRLEKATRPPGTKDGSSTGGNLTHGKEVSGQVLPGDYVDYELHEWDRENALELEIDIADDGDIDIFVSPFSEQQRARPRDDEHVFGDFSTSSPKRIRLEPTNVELQDIEALYISVHANSGNTSSSGPVTFRIRSTTASSQAKSTSPTVDGDAEDDNHDPDDIQCKNCHQWVPQRTHFLHENFCLRNNILCPKCNTVFQKRSPEWINHWHCPHDDFHGNDTSSQTKHNDIFHSPRPCPNCSFEAPSLPVLAAHRTTTCPGKPILCRFCHLVVPQQGEGDPDVLDAEVLLSGLTPHELIDGGRTTECHLCRKIVRLRDMNTHLRHHDLNRLSRPPPPICTNPNCGRTLNGPHNHNSSTSATSQSLGLCSVCFGPLYADVYDPEGKALRRRIERRYLSQMLSGCGNSWCCNTYCKTGRKNMNPSDDASGQRALPTKEVLSQVKPLIDSVAIGPASVNDAPIYFCTDESSQSPRRTANMLALEEKEVYGKEYDIAWCVAAVEASGGTDSIDRARGWLSSWAPHVGEQMAE